MKQRFATGNGDFGVPEIVDRRAAGERHLRGQNG
jgi:hypothetical protein